MPESGPSSSSPSPWLAMEVRPWLVLAGVLLIVAIAMSIFGLAASMRERRVIQNGQTVDATVVYVGRSMAHEGSRDEELNVQVQYITPDGKAMTAWGELPRKPGEMVTWKQIVPVHIDPADPSYWTARDEPKPLGLVLAVPLLCLPAAILCAAIAWLRQRTMRAIAATGASRTAQVITVKISPLAPLSKLIGLTMTDDATRRVVHCYWPGKRGGIRAGDSIEIKTSANGRHAMIAH